jgi:aspartyl-tRNA(Asn)/glutamyl-tRNA(Gln) amidotransferase subunit A
MADELYRKSAFELAALIRAHQLKPSELMQATLDRIDAVNPKVVAFSAIRPEQAMAEARALDQKLARREEVGALVGLPLGVKDLEDVAGMATTFGSVPFKDYMPKSDSAQVARLKAAGAIVVGKTTTPEFGCTGFTRNMLSGVTRNPWNLERTPGGSSGGSGAAIAASMVPLATGSDGGGSIRIPASYTGCFGYKPSRGRIPLPMMMDLTDWVLTTVPGPLTRTVRDAALYLDAAAGYHPSDPDSLPHPGISYLAMLDRLPHKLRIAFHPDLGHAIVQHDVMREVVKAVDAFKQLGYSVDTLDDKVPDVGIEWLRMTATFVCVHLRSHRGPSRGIWPRLPRWRGVCHSPRMGQIWSG